MRIKVTTDSTCDLSKELLETYNITIIPLYVLREGKIFHDGVTITPTEIFRHVDSGGALCTTAAVNIDDYTRCFEEFSAAYDEVIHINIGSDFSSSYQNACIVAQAYDNVRIIDSQNLTTGQGQLVIKAAEMALAGYDAKMICTEIHELAGRVETSFLVNRLDYIHKGGRCSLVAALGANILHLNPCIEVTGGKMQVTKKYRGSFERCIETYAEERLAGRDDIVKERVFITYTEVPQQVLEAARAAVIRYGAFREVIETQAGCTVSCHCGPGTLGIVFMRKEK